MTSPAAGRVPARRAAAADVVVLTAATLAVGWYCGAFSGFPKGYDAWGHLAKARMVRSSFPHINWNDEWYSGQPAFLGSYPPGYHLLLAGTSWATGWSLPHSMVVLAAVATVAVVVGCYLVVLGITGSRVAGLLSAGLLLASPTLWDQVVELGLYPRFTALSFGALAAGSAALERGRSTRRRALVTVALLAASLGTHPVSGGICCGVVALVLLSAPAPDLPARARRALAAPAAAVAVCGWFYVPLVLVPRAQSAFTDVEIPLRGVEFGWPTRGVLSALPPAMLPAVVVVAVAVAGTWLRAEPRVRASRLLRAPGVPLVVVPRGDPRSDAVSASALVAVGEWRARRRAALPHLFAAGGLLAASLLAVGYGLIGRVTDHFTYYVNGLQPRDLLVYPAWLASAALGVGAHLALRDRAAGARAVAAAVGAAAVAASLASTVWVLPSGVHDASDGATDAMIGLLPAQAYRDGEHRIAGFSDATSRWINAVTDVGQVRGYDDHGNLHLDWQYWLERSMSGSGPVSTTAQQHYLLDYYAARWLFTDSAAATAKLAADPAFTPLGREQLSSDVTAWRYLDAHPIATAVTAPTLLVIGDDTHYDVVLRTLALDDVGADRLLPVHGPSTLTGLTPAQLRGYPTVLVYGAAPGPHPSTAALQEYVRGGGHLVVDVADSASPDRVGAAVGAPVTASHVASLTQRWGFGGVDASAASGWSPPSDSEDSAWDVRTPDAHVAGEVLLSAAGNPVVVRASRGAGVVVWSGLNLPYHVVASGDLAALRYLGGLLGAAVEPQRVTPVTDVRHDGEHRDVTLPPGVDGVLVREYVSADWHARAGGSAVPLLRAGPDMMFVRVPRHDTPVTVHLEYRPGAQEWTGAAVSVLAVLALVGYALGVPRPAPVRAARALRQKFQGQWGSSTEPKAVDAAASAAGSRTVTRPAAASPAREGPPR